MMDGGFRETRHLKDLLLVNLDLIQQQQELLSEKDKRIQHLQHENETLKCRLDRIERRMSLCSQKQVQQQPLSDGNTTQSPAAAAQHLKSTDKKNATCDQLLDSSASAVGATSKHELHTKSNKLPESSGKKNIPTAKEGVVGVLSPGQVRLPVGSTQSKVSVSGPRFGPDNAEILTTDMLYYSSVADNLVERELMDGAEVLVPSWRVNMIHSKYVMEGTENLNDGVFLKRHQKSELEEKRRKRWDVQRLRDLHLLQKQHQQNIATRDVRNQTQEPGSFLPSTDRVCYIDINDCIPVAVFGHALPRISSKQFELPWSEADASQTAVDSRKVKKRKRKN